MEPRSEPHGVEECFSRALRKAKVAMQAHPEEALLLVVAAAAFVRLTPRRWWMWAASTVLVHLMEPALLTLGCAKAFELVTRRGLAGPN